MMDKTVEFSKNNKEKLITGVVIGAVVGVLMPKPITHVVFKEFDTQKLGDAQTEEIDYAVADFVADFKAGDITHIEFVNSINEATRKISKGRYEDYEDYISSKNAPAKSMN